MKCPKHGMLMYQTEWRPPRGLAQYLRQFKCGKIGCESVEYKRGVKIEK